MAEETTTTFNGSMPAKSASGAGKSSSAPRKTSNRTKGTTKMAQSTELSQEISTLKADVARLTDQLGRVADAGVDTANRRKNSALKSAKANGEAVYSDIISQIEDLEKRTRKGVRDNPLQSLGIALGIGFFAALLMRR